MPVNSPRRRLDGPKSAHTVNAPRKLQSPRQPHKGKHAHTHRHAHTQILIHCNRAPRRLPAKAAATYYADLRRQTQTALSRGGCPTIDSPFPQTAVHAQTPRRLSLSGAGCARGWGKARCIQQAATTSRVSGSCPLPVARSSGGSAKATFMGEKAHQSYRSASGGSYAAASGHASTDGGRWRSNLLPEGGTSAIASRKSKIVRLRRAGSG
eukprot:6174544-Pleurochrysis_carterae.AAC.2